jgi:hypothetical protein
MTASNNKKKKTITTVPVRKMPPRVESVPIQLSNKVPKHDHVYIATDFDRKTSVVRYECDICGIPYGTS